MQITTHSVHTALVPRSVAIVGATERVGALGRDVFRNVLAGGFQGEVFAVNPKHTQIGEHRCYGRLTDLPTPPDLVVVVTPAAAVPQVVKEAAERGVAGVLVLS
ncbi:MAG TPA: CoA-binding protein, partial [Burkholderiaceae bacterium]|nr:CoA-binding protein [Burkholderiaceae bacterium]